MSENGNMTGKRDPFARPGQPGYVLTQIGNDGPIPPQYLSKLREAFNLVSALVLNKPFELAFKDIVEKGTGLKQPSDIFLQSLNRMIIHNADTTKVARIKQAAQEEDLEKNRNHNYKRVPAFTTAGQNNTWIKESYLAQANVKQLAGTIIHEAAHVAGLSANPIFELALQKLHDLSGYPRPPFNY